jgi:hypothetical protein
VHPQRCFGEKICIWFWRCETRAPEIQLTFNDHLRKWIRQQKTVCFIQRFVPSLIFPPQTGNCTCETLPKILTRQCVLVEHSIVDRQSNCEREVIWIICHIHASCKKSNK